MLIMCSLIAHNVFVDCTNPSAALMSRISAARMADRSAVGLLNSHLASQGIQSIAPEFRQMVERFLEDNRIDERA